MISKLNKSVAASIHKEAKLRYPEEACGLIVSVGKRFESINCKNISEAPLEAFVISPDEFSAAEDVGEVVAIWHTHVDRPSNPSHVDIHACNSLGLNWFIFDIHKTDDGFVVNEPYFLEPDLMQVEYVGRPYVYGVYDCLTIARDYYKREFDIPFVFMAKGYPEIENWYERDMNLLADNFDKNGFVQLIDKEPQEGDLFLIQLGSSLPNHIAIYLGANRILHHCRGRMSNIDVYLDGYWQKHTTHHLRHRDRIENAD